MIRVNQRFKSCIIVFFLTAVLICPICLSTPAQAQYYTGPISSAMGGTGRAASEPEEGVFLNPAVLPHAKKFSTALFYSNGLLGEGLQQNDLAISLVDKTEEVFIPGSISYLRRHRTFPGLPSVDEEYYSVAIGQFVIQHLSLGLRVHYHTVDQDSGKDYSYWGGALGALWAPSPKWGAALVYDNFIINNKTTHPKHLENIPEVGVGLVYLHKTILKARFDASQPLAENPHRKWKMGLGAETSINHFIALRVGGQADQVSNQKFLTLGWAFLGPRLKIDYSFRKNITDNKGSMHGVDLRVPFW